MVLCATVRETLRIQTVVFWVVTGVPTVSYSQKFVWSQCPNLTGCAAAAHALDTPHCRSPPNILYYLSVFNHSQILIYAK